MKTVFFALLMFLQIMVVAQIAKPVTNAELKVLVGTWTGTLVATGFVDGKNQHTYTTALEVVDMQDSLMFNFTFTGEGGKQLIEKYPLRIYDNGDKLSFDSTQFEITDIRRRGIRLTMYAEREGYDQNRRVEWQHVFIIGPGILNITKGIRYPDMIDFSIQKRLILTKK
ncbi:MAG: hypothetical protein IPP81_13215 [Chitinophagaceae bacterium]|nr:hypothetical protein [Chitinophagaceae bacterium]